MTTMMIIGLTGGIASGKSTAGRVLRSLGLPVVDADVLAREAVALGSPALAAIHARFGDGVLQQDGTLNRPALASIIFHDDNARRDLNHIVHPAVAQLSLQKFDELQSAGHTHAVYEVPLLFENNLDGWLSPTLLVCCSVDVQRQRLMARDRLSEADAQARIDAQMPLADKQRRATFVVHNDADEAALADAVTSLARTQQWVR
jgi:dephospho-CoA kinase